jgi:hypothetical protein
MVAEFEMTVTLTLVLTATCHITGSELFALAKICRCVGCAFAANIEPLADTGGVVVGGVIGGVVVGGVIGGGVVVGGGDVGGGDVGGGDVGGGGPASCATHKELVTIVARNTVSNCDTIFAIVIFMSVLRKFKNIWH